MKTLRLIFIIIVAFASPILAAGATSSPACIFSKAIPDVELFVPMRDGTRLPTYIFLPQDKAGKYPCVLIRHPLGAKMAEQSWTDLAEQGYMVAVQSTRACCDTTGTAIPYFTDGWGQLEDGYDAVEWLAKSEWCNGKVATIGTSATGITQLLLAPTRPPHLTCQYIEVGAPSLYHYVVRPGGQLRKEQVEGWLKIQNRSSSVFQLLTNRVTYDDLWSQFNSLTKASSINVPQIHVGGWYDIFLQGTIDAFSAAQEQSATAVRPYHKLIIGPWGHRWKEAPTSLGEFPSPQNGRQPPIPITFCDWLDFHMKGAQNNVTKAPSVQYYVMGPFDGTSSCGNCWKAAHKWPPDATSISLFLSRQTLVDESKLSLQESVIDVLFDSQNPVPTIGGRNLFSADGPKNLNSIEARNDVALFTTEPLLEDTEVTGRLHASFYVTGVQQERDICCRLADLYPTGQSILVAEGIAHITPKEAGKAQRVDVDLWSTSMVFAKNHKIRLLVSGSNFPSYEASLAPNQDPSSRVCFSIVSGGKSPSFLSLPVVKNYPLPEGTVCESTLKKTTLF